MITNIIKNIIKDFPSVANSTIYLFSKNKDNGEFTIALTDNNNILLVVQCKQGAAQSVDDYKKQLIADHIYMATQSDTYDSDHKPITMSVLADTIDKLINTEVVLWQL